MTERARRIETLLRERLRPVHVELRDESAAHAGHAGAAAGGGHYHVLVVAAEFEGRTALEQHRMVHEALASMIGGEIHALGIRTLPPSRWSPG